MDIRSCLHITAWLFIFAALAGCNKPLSYPETKDPIFEDVLHDLENSKRLHQQAEKDVERAQDEYNKAPLRSRTKKIMEDALIEAKKNRELAGQDLLYKSQRVTNRRLLDRETYKKAFDEGKEWPRPEEYAEYLTHKKLEQAPREWKPHIAPRAGSGHSEGAPQKSGSSH